MRWIDPTCHPLPSIQYSMNGYGRGRIVLLLLCRTSSEIDVKHVGGYILARKTPSPLQYLRSFLAKVWYGKMKGYEYDMAIQLNFILTKRQRFNEMVRLFRKKVACSQ